MMPLHNSSSGYGNRPLVFSQATGRLIGIGRPGRIAEYDPATGETQEILRIAYTLSNRCPPGAIVFYRLISPKTVSTSRLDRHWASPYLMQIAKSCGRWKMRYIGGWTVMETIPDLFRGLYDAPYKSNRGSAGLHHE
ncbi:MAG: hypothetical protein U0930_17535 [Pirellulales bacterium]